MLLDYPRLDFSADREIFHNLPIAGQHDLGLGALRSRLLCQRCQLLRTCGVAPSQIAEDSSGVVDALNSNVVCPKSQVQGVEERRSRQAADIAGLNGSSSIDDGYRSAKIEFVSCIGNAQAPTDISAERTHLFEILGGIVDGSGGCEQNTQEQDEGILKHIYYEKGEEQDGLALEQSVGT